MSIQRYDEVGQISTITETTDGDFVLYADHAAEVERLTGERDALEAMDRTQCPNCNNCIRDLREDKARLLAERDAAVKQAQEFESRIISAEMFAQSCMGDIDRFNFMQMQRDAAVARVEQMEGYLEKLKVLRDQYHINIPAASEKVGRDMAESPGYWKGALDIVQYYATEALRPLHAAAQDAKPRATKPGQWPEGEG